VERSPYSEVMYYVINFGLDDYNTQNVPYWGVMSENSVLSKNKEKNVEMENYLQVTYFHSEMLESVA
jgi:hypothetical protein